MEEKYNNYLAELHDVSFSCTNLFFIHNIMCVVGAGATAAAKSIVDGDIIVDLKKNGIVLSSSDS
jgi:hypothetical protein